QQIDQGKTLRGSSCIRRFAIFILLRNHSTKTVKSVSSVPKYILFRTERNKLKTTGVSDRSRIR
uniref:hypothetical protein n=1 Tax=Bacteroides faecis TaxID=674529 RepID=UPI001E5C594C